MCVHISLVSAFFSGTRNAEWVSGKKKAIMKMRSLLPISFYHIGQK